MQKRTNIDRRPALQAELDAYRADIGVRLAEQDARLKIVEDNTVAILDIVSAWNNAKGFVRVMQAMSATIKVAAVIFAAWLALWYLIKFGHLPPK